MYVFFFFKQKTAYEMRISDWSSDVCSSDLKKASEEADKKGYKRAKREVSAPQIPVRRAPQLAPDAPKTMDEALDRAVRDEEVKIGRASCRERVGKYV